MDFFYVDKLVDMSVGFEDQSQTRIIINPVPAELISSGSIPAQFIYCSTAACIQNISGLIHKKQLDVTTRTFKKDTKKQLMAIDGFPINITNFDPLDDDFETLGSKKVPSSKFIPVEERLKPLADAGKKDIRIAIINGMGTGIGDSIIGLRALNIMHTRLSKLFTNIHIDLFQTPFNTSTTKKSTYEQEKIVKNVFGLPLPVSSLLTYDAVADFSSMVLRDNFDNQPMVDFFLESLGVDPKTVSNEEKRPFIKINEHIKQNNEWVFKILKHSTNVNRPLLLLHPRASVPIRSMPDDVVIKLAKKIVKETNYIIVGTFSNQTLTNDVKKALGKEQDRFVDLSAYSKTFDEFTFIISQMDSIITVDTCTYHIADSFNIPTVTIFPTIDTDIRTKYYPLVAGLQLKDKNNRLRGTHVSYKKEDLDYVSNLWGSFSLAPVLETLEKLNTKKFKGEASIVPAVKCSTCDTEVEDKPTDRYLQFRLITCHNCETEFTMPRVAGDYNFMYDNKSDDYNYQHYISGNERTEVIGRYMNGWRFTDIKEFLTYQPNKGKLLDVGCANGFLTAFALDEGYDSYGIDVSEKAIAFAEDTMNLKGRVAVCSDLSKLPKPLPKKYDIITSFELVEHLEDPNAFARDVYNSLEPGGFWIFSTPNRNRIQFKLGVKNTGKHRGHDTGDYPYEHLSRFTDKSHRVLAERNGFNIFFQNTSIMSATSIADAVGPFPILSAKDANGVAIPLDGNAINNVAFNYFQHMATSVKGYGNFLITFAQKPY